MYHADRCAAVLHFTHIFSRVVFLAGLGFPSLSLLVMVKAGYRMWRSAGIKIRKASPNATSPVPSDTAHGTQHTQMKGSQVHQETRTRSMSNRADVRAEAHRTYRIPRRLGGGWHWLHGRVQRTRTCRQRPMGFGGGGGGIPGTT